MVTKFFIGSFLLERYKSMKKNFFEDNFPDFFDWCRLHLSDPARAINNAYTAMANTCIIQKLEY